MLQYIIILLDDNSTSFCHYDIPQNRKNNLIDIDVLKKGIRFAMKNNLRIQFVYPEEDIPKSYVDIINSTNHIKIKPYISTQKDDTDVLVFNEPPFDFIKGKHNIATFRLTLQEFLNLQDSLISLVCKTVKRINVVIRGKDFSRNFDFVKYQTKLEHLSELIEKEYLAGNFTQWNILTDKMMLSEMNNCGAGDTSITLAPNGKFYICPAFYYDDIEDAVGDIQNGLNIPNQQLYKLKYSPICLHCDAYQCKRCVWLNRRMTLEVNTPSHEQCVSSHIERNTSRKLLNNIRRYGDFLKDTIINEIDYLDPFEKVDQWKQENL